MVSLPVFAADNQENPDTATVIYNGMSLLNFYTDTLDFVLIRNQSGVNSSVQKAPYANIPVALSESLTSFVGSSQSLSGGRHKDPDLFCFPNM